jgi:hypothetical protein
MNSPYAENAQRKRTKKKIKKKKSAGRLAGLGFSKCAGGVRRFLFAGPSPRSKKQEARRAAEA